MQFTSKLSVCTLLRNMTRIPIGPQLYLFVDMNKVIMVGYNTSMVIRDRM